MTIGKWRRWQVEDGHADGDWWEDIIVAPDGSQFRVYDLDGQADDLLALINAAGFTGIAEELHEFTVAKGWWNRPLEERVPRLLAWLREEVDEAAEAWEQHGDLEYTTRDAEGKIKPEGFPVELADIVLLALDLWQGTGVDLSGALRRKLDYNKVRRYRRDAEGRDVGP